MANGWRLRVSWRSVWRGAGTEIELRNRPCGRTRNSECRTARSWDKKAEGSAEKSPPCRSAFRVIPHPPEAPRVASRCGRPRGGEPDCGLCKIRPILEGHSDFRD